VKLLFDENLSPDLPRLLATLFPNSAHVRDLGLVGADDLVIWSVAAKEGFALVTKDDDFMEVSILRGAPPKVVMIGLGNCRSSAVAALLQAEKLKLETFDRDAAASILELCNFPEKPNDDR
jgi:predicted nuclease of predicted toxin-antitoxin system